MSFEDERYIAKRIDRIEFLEQEIAKLKEENERLKFQLDVAEAVLSVQVTKSALAYFDDKIKSLENNVTEN